MRVEPEFAYVGFDMTRYDDSIQCTDKRSGEYIGHIIYHKKQMEYVCYMDKWTEYGVDYLRDIVGYLEWLNEGLDQ